MAMRKCVVALTFLLVVSGCGGSSDTATPVTTVAPAETQAPTTTAVPTTTVAVTTTVAATTTAAPATTAAPTTTMDPTNLPESVNTQVVDGYDYRLDGANVLNHLRPDNEACIFHALGDATFKALRTRPMDQAETDQVMHCFGRGTEGGQVVDVPVALDTIPLFVRGGTVLPMAAENLRSTPSSDTLRTWRIYPQPEGTPDRHSQFYDDDGDTVDALAGESCLTRLCLSRTGETVHLDWQRSGNWQPAFDNVTLWLAGASTLAINGTERKTGETIDFTVSQS